MLLNSKTDLSGEVKTIPFRPRRLKTSESLRQLLDCQSLRITDLVQPLFVVEGNGAPQAIKSMPGIDRFPLQSLLKECETLLSLGIKAVSLFPCIDARYKSPCAKEALNPDTIILKAIRLIKEHFPELTLFCDIALDPYTTHGHDGILNAQGTDVDNDASLTLLAQQACLVAEAGGDFVAPSDKMDGTVGVLRSTLDAKGFPYVGILAYTAKFNSSLYGPFRDAVGSSQGKRTYLNKSSYQLHPANTREALRLAKLDEAQGADMLMVKPAGAYLDIIYQYRQITHLPIAAYQVSGEYAQIHAAAKQGYLSLESTRDESLIAIKRAGADIIYTYFAKSIAQSLHSQN
jgi:porphobilinogen synthase